MALGHDGPTLELTVELPTFADKPSGRWPEGANVVHIALRFSDSENCPFGDGEPPMSGTYQLRNQMEPSVFTSTAILLSSLGPPAFSTCRRSAATLCARANGKGRPSVGSCVAEMLDGAVESVGYWLRCLLDRSARNAQLR